MAGKGDKDTVQSDIVTVRPPSPPRAVDMLKGLVGPTMGEEEFLQTG